MEEIYADNRRKRRTGTPLVLSPSSLLLPLIPPLPMISRKRILPTTPSLTPLPLLLSRDVTGHIPAGARHFLPQGPTHRHCSRYGGGWIILFDILLDLHKYHLLYHILDIIGDGDGDGDGDSLGLGLGFGFGARSPSPPHPRRRRVNTLTLNPNPNPKP